MRDNDDLDNIPPMVPPRDEVVSRQHTRERPDLVRHPRHDEAHRGGGGSSWPVWLMLVLLVFAMGGGAAYAYNVHQDTLRTMDQANRRIADLEGRLAMVGDTAEETTGNIIERVDLNFTEIDKLWAARNATNRNVTDLTGRVALVESAVEENATALADTSQRVVRGIELTESTRREVNTLATDMRQTQEQLASLNTTVQRVQNTAQELVNLRATIDTAAGASGGLDERISRVEEAVEAIDAYRLQINQTVFRLQQNIEAMQASLRQ